MREEFREWTESVVKPEMEIEEIDDIICKIINKYGSDGHKYITLFILKLCETVLS